MRKFFVFIIFLSSFAVLAQTKYAAVDTLLTQINNEGEFNGIVLVGDSVKIHFAKAYGYADIEKKKNIDLNTQFYIASISKQFTATLILILVENNKLHLDQPIKDIIADFPYNEVTIHHLLSNTSGITGYIDYFSESWNKSKQANTDDVINYLLAEKPKLNFETGTEFQYSNTNYVILAKVIELISGKSYPAFLENQILKPCGLTKTYASSKPYFTEQDENVALGYVVEGDKLTKAEQSKIKYVDRVNYLSGIQGDGSVVTSVSDLYVWHKAISSNKVLSDSLTQLMFAQTDLTDGSKSDYGYGWYTNGEIADHTGSWPGYQTRIIRNLKNGLVGISFKNVEINNWNWIVEFDKLINN